MNLSGFFAYTAHFFKTKRHFALSDFEKKLKKTLIELFVYIKSLILLEVWLDINTL